MLLSILENYFLQAIQDIDTNSFVINAGFKNINMPNEKVNNYITPKLAIRTILISVALVGFVTCHITINHLRLTQVQHLQKQYFIYHSLISIACNYFKIIKHIAT